MTNLLANKPANSSVETIRPAERMVRDCKNVRDLVLNRIASTKAIAAAKQEPSNKGHYSLTGTESIKPGQSSSSTL
jgi:hypothetical protein